MEEWSLKKEYKKPKLEIGENPIHHKAVLVAPGFEVKKIDPKENNGKLDPKKEHRTGLLWETRIKLFAAFLLWKSGEVERVVVGGAQIREMKESFAELMKVDLINFGVPEDKIDTEEYTRDTSTQVEWLQKNIKNYDNSAAFLTDPAHAKLIRELVEDYKLEEVPVLETEVIIRRLFPKVFPERDIERFESLFKKTDKSPWGIKYALREALVTFIVKYFDDKGEYLKGKSKNRMQF